MWRRKQKKNGKKSEEARETTGSQSEEQNPSQGGSSAANPSEENPTTASKPEESSREGDPVDNQRPGRSTGGHSFLRYPILSSPLNTIRRIFSLNTWENFELPQGGALRQSVSLFFSRRTASPSAQGEPSSNSPERSGLEVAVIPKEKDSEVSVCKKRETGTDSTNTPDITESVLVETTSLSIPAAPEDSRRSPSKSSKSSPSVEKHDSEKGCSRELSEASCVDSTKETRGSSTRLSDGGSLSEQALTDSHPNSSGLGDKSSGSSPHRCDAESSTIPRAAETEESKQVSLPQSPEEPPATAKRLSVKDKHAPKRDPPSRFVSDSERPSTSAYIPTYIPTERLILGSRTPLSPELSGLPKITLQPVETCASELKERRRSKNLEQPPPARPRRGFLPSALTEIFRRLARTFHMLRLLIFTAWDFVSRVCRAVRTFLSEECRMCSPTFTPTETTPSSQLYQGSNPVTPRTALSRVQYSMEDLLDTLERRGCRADDCKLFKFCEKSIKSREAELLPGDPEGDSKEKRHEACENPASGHPRQRKDEDADIDETEYSDDEGDHREN